MTKITYYGHSCFSFDLDGFQLLVDPFISGNSLAGDIDIEEISADAILLTHGHGDHVMDVSKIAKEDTPVVTNYEVANWCADQGLNGVGMNHGGIWEGAFGTVKYVPAMHSSSLPDGSYGGNPGGFVVQTPKARFYIAGDTCLMQDMKLIPLLCGKLDWCILPVGGYFTMHYQEAVHAAKFVECNQVIGCHFDTFPPIKIDHADAVSTFSAAGISLKLPAVGETFDI